MGDVKIRLFENNDLQEMCFLWNEVVEEGNAFPQTEILDEKTAKDFFGSQTATVVALLDDSVLGLYILHPNNVGRCSHIANASYAVSSKARGKHIGRLLVEDSLKRCAEHGYRGLQFNAVVDSNAGARHLYESLGFTHVGTIPHGFLRKDGFFEDTHIYYHAVA